MSIFLVNDESNMEVLAKNFIKNLWEIFIKLLFVNKGESVF